MTMSFMDSYKRLEKLCDEIYGGIYGDNHGVKAYIEVMNNTPLGARYVPGWDEDLKKLKHYKWVRNQIVHDPGCTEENMCVYGDAQWLDNFRSRIMSANDPLALYRKARNPQPTQRPRQTYTPEPRTCTYPQRTGIPRKAAGCLTYMIGILLAAAAVVLSASVF